MGDNDFLKNKGDQKENIESVDKDVNQNDSHGDAKILNEEIIIEKSVKNPKFLKKEGPKEEHIINEDTGDGDGVHFAKIVEEERDIKRKKIRLPESSLKIEKKEIKTGEVSAHNKIQKAPENKKDIRQINIPEKNYARNINPVESGGIKKDDVKEHDVKEHDVKEHDVKEHDVKEHDVKEHDEKKDVGVKNDSGEKNQIPVLKTFHYDIQKLARTKGGAELRSLLAKELEEKQKAQKEYEEKTRSLLKESAVLRDKKNKILRKQSEQKRSIDEKNINDAISGALDYMHHGVITKKEENIKQNNALEKDSAREKESYEPVQNLKKDKINKKIFSISETLKKKFTPTEEGRKILKEKQESIVEKEGLRKSLQQFEEKRAQLKEKGAEIRDARQYSLPTIKNNILFRQNIVALLIVVGLVVGLGAIIYTIITQPKNQSTSVSIDDLYQSKDIVDVANTVFVDVSTDTNEWMRALLENRSASIQKFIPYSIEDNEQAQTTFEEFSNLRDAEITPDLFKLLGEYYFIGKYSNKTGDTHFIILNIQNYSNTLVLLPRWEKRLYQSVAKIFPTFLSENSIRNNITSKSLLIDNKNVKILTDVTDIENSLIYYFFNPSYLIIIVGNQDAVNKINTEIRSANI